MLWWEVVFYGDGGSFGEMFDVSHLVKKDMVCGVVISFITMRERRVRFINR